MSGFFTPDAFRMFTYWLKTRNRYVLNEHQQHFVDAFRMSLKHRELVVKENTSLWRAQRGCQEVREASCEPPADYKPEVKRVPYGENRMRPEPHKAKEGRANSKGMSVLYLADDVETALSEMRSWSGDYMTCATFRTTRDLMLIDCSRRYSEAASRWYQHGEDDVQEFVWHEIDEAFATPVSDTDDTADYTPTQYLAEIVCSESYDGLRFSSSIGKGHNFVLFGGTNVAFIDSRLYRTEKVAFEFEEVRQR